MPFLLLGIAELRTFRFCQKSYPEVNRTALKIYVKLKLNNHQRPQAIFRSLEMIQVTETFYHIQS